MKGEDPFDALADDAIREDDAGEMLSFDEILRMKGFLWTNDIYHQIHQKSRQRLYWFG